MFTKTKLLQVEQLKSSGQLNKMEESQIEEYASKLNQFTEAYPEQEKQLKSALEHKNYDQATQCVSSISDLLRTIYADDLAGKFSASAIIFGQAEPSEILAEVTNLLAAAAALSIDIQMAGQDDEMNAEAAPAASPAQSAASVSQVEKTILAVDDAAFFLNTLKNYMANSPFKLTCVNSGKTALNFLQSHRPDLFILDIEMPGMDGYELAREIRKQGHTAPIIFLTGNSDRDSVVKAVRSGGSDFIIKPISKAQVFKRISKYL